MFVIKKDNKVVLADNNREKLETTLKHMPNLKGIDIEETKDEYKLINGQYRVGGLTIKEQNEAIRQTRESLYKDLTDQLTLRKLRKQAIGAWTEADEAEYVEMVKKMSSDIDTGNPYIKE